MLREYQQRTINMLYQWAHDNKGHPCIELPTGAGKSWIIAALCKDAIQHCHSTKILMLTHVKELIEQDADKLREAWPNAPLGIYSAGLGKRELGEPITFASIQSIRKKARQIGHIDLVMIDEAHLVSHKDEGAYRTFLNELIGINPALRIVGLTATPWRLGHGLITDKPAIFDSIIQPTSIEELIHLGYLAPLRSKVTKERFDLGGVHKRGGEYIDAELQAAVDKNDKNIAVVREVIALSGGRKAWMFFCAGVQHAQHIKDILVAHGIKAECVLGDTPKSERAKIISDFKAGRITALTNANVLTTGFDYPDIDLIAMLRPTMSPVLYIQMAGRGLRPKSHTDHCLVLDFAGVVEMHGPITAVRPPTKKGSGNGEAPVKVCDNCLELVAISARVCPACGAAFPEPEAKKLVLRNDDIMGIEPLTMEVKRWRWEVHIGRKTPVEMLRVKYYDGSLTSKPVIEYLPVRHDAWAGQNAMRRLMSIASKCGVNQSDLSTDKLSEICRVFESAKPPSVVEYKGKGPLFDIISTKWETVETC